MFLFFSGQNSPPSTVTSGVDYKDYNSKKSKTPPRKSPIIITVEVENPPQAPLVSEEIFEGENRNKIFRSSMEPICTNTTEESSVVFGNTLQTLRQRNEKKCENAQNESDSIENNTTSDLGGDHLQTSIIMYRVYHVYFRVHI